MWIHEHAILKCSNSSEVPDGVARRGIIRRTYENARDIGDANVYFVDGSTLFGKTDRDACTIDGCHPNDLGFLRMAEGIFPAVKQGLRMYNLPDG